MLGDRLWWSIKAHYSHFERFLENLGDFCEELKIFMVRKVHRLRKIVFLDNRKTEIESLQTDPLCIGNITSNCTV